MTELGMTRDPKDPRETSSCDGASVWLDEYVDGELDLARVVEVEAHLEACTLCRRDVEATQALLRQVEALPPEQEPPRDLWQAIAPRLQERPSASEAAPGPAAIKANRSTWSVHGWRFWAGQAVAAGLFLLLGFGAAQWQTNAGNDMAPLRLAEGTPASVSLEESAESSVLPVGLAQGSPSFLVAEAEFLRAKEALLMSVLQRRESMSPESLELLYRNLQIIDAATVELRHALNLDPANPRLEGWVLDNYRRELSLLKRLTSQDA